MKKGTVGAIKALKENESGRSVEEISRDLGITKGTFYTWRRKFVILMRAYAYKIFVQKV
ncbi:transposase [Phaeodactylibacter sp.]|uniref:transposase n=1 Tax=Phaeodactylibacter sp. TaxID=1940289 RepID=UPI003413AB3B|nr:helix-turn-helix domain-containing protein [Flavobacteriales bacterium]